MNPQSVKKLNREFYTGNNVVSIARKIIGKKLVTFFGGILTSGIISETEAYAGIIDKASHAFGGRRTARTRVLYERGGVAYIYLCYGIHSLFNVVSGHEGTPHAILIRGIVPVDGIQEMSRRTGKKIDPQMEISGPGKVCTALGIHYSSTGTDLTGNTIWLEDSGMVVSKADILISRRIGVDYAGKDALLPWRFNLRLDK
ncbi:MAG: DNA-3-methyladenine glycosylase [Bacteroidia bacterium]|nr:DNA-3-methyladenine glycosylase [Bacteroidia bacterium]